MGCQSIDFLQPSNITMNYYPSTSTAPASTLQDNTSFQLSEISPVDNSSPFFPLHETAHPTPDIDPFSEFDPATIDKMIGDVLNSIEQNNSQQEISNGHQILAENAPSRANHSPQVNNPENLQPAPNKADEKKSCPIPPAVQGQKIYGRRRRLKRNRQYLHARLNSMLNTIQRQVSILHTLNIGLLNLARTECDEIASDCFEA